MRNIYLIFGFLILLISCNDSDSTQNSIDSIIDSVSYINEACCSKLISLSTQPINNSCEEFQGNGPSMFDPINFSDFEIFQNIQPEDILTIEYELIENCETKCTIVCNRPSGIPIKLLAAY